jgi:hypothetical protein
MKTSWTSGLTSEQKEEIRMSFGSAGRLRERLTALLNDKITSSTKESLGKDLYANASWAYQQADAVGYRRALHEVMSLLED